MSGGFCSCCTIKRHHLPDCSGIACAKRAQERKHGVSARTEAAVGAAREAITISARRRVRRLDDRLGSQAALLGKSLLPVQNEAEAVTVGIWNSETLCFWGRV
jgi:hypothetical protein